MAESVSKLQVWWAIALALALLGMTEAIAAQSGRPAVTTAIRDAEIVRLGEQAVEHFGAGRLAQAAATYERILAIVERTGDREHPDALIFANNLAYIYQLLERYDDAVSLFRRTIEVSVRVLGREHPNTLAATNQLAGLYRTRGLHAQADALLAHATGSNERVPSHDDANRTTTGRTATAAEAQPSPAAREALRLSEEVQRLRSLGRPTEAAPLAERALQMLERLLGPDEPITTAYRGTVAGLYRDLTRYAEAETLYRRMLASREGRLGPDHADTIRVLDELAYLYRIQGRITDAEPLARRVLETSERVLGAEHDSTLNYVNNLATVLSLPEQYVEAERLYRRAYESRARLLGRDHNQTLFSLGALAAFYTLQGRYAEAETLYRQEIQLSERARGADDFGATNAVGSLASLLMRQGRYTEAEPLFRRAIETFERTLGRDHLATALYIGHLASLYSRQGRHADADTLHQRVLDHRRQGLGNDHPDTIPHILPLASSYRIQGRYAEAEALYRRALEITERTRNEGGYDSLATEGLALLYQDLGRNAEAEALLRRVGENLRRSRGNESPETLAAMNHLADLYRIQGRHAEAEPLHFRAYEVRDRMMGGDNPATLASLEGLLASRHQIGPASANTLELARRLLAAQRGRAQMYSADQGGRAQLERERSTSTRRFTLFADLAWNPADGGNARRADLLQEAFVALQDSIAGSADRAIAEQAARRYVVGQNAELAELIRERQQLENRWTRLDADLVTAFASAPGNAAERPASIRIRLEAVQTRLSAIDARLRTEAPDYFALVSPTSLDVATAQRLLAANEAILLAVPSRFGTHVVAVTRNAIEWRRSAWNAERMRGAVERLRRDVDPRIRRPAGSRMAFDRSTAHQLHQELIAPVAPLLAGRERVYVAAGGALAALPFSVLVAAPPQGADDNPAALRATSWLGDSVALVHVPSIQSLALLRRAARSAGRRDGFFGAGDPVIGAPEADGQPDRGLPTPEQLFQPGRTRDGGLRANLTTLRQLPRLPGTARELEAVRATLGAPQTSVLLAERATETNVRAADLSGAGILLFSTHGLTFAEGNMIGVGESGLVLTPPAEARESDDGFLAASEVTTLRLNADWVILSACNTATGDGVNSAGLGGLARAFFYAGARNLLASHWLVSDEVAPVLITRTLALERSGTTRAEAFRQAMREIRTDASRDAWAHPFFWAPFVLVGDGG